MWTEKAGWRTMPYATATVNAAIICSGRRSWPWAGRMFPMNPYSAWRGRNGRTTAFRNCWTTISEKATSATCPRLACAASRSSMRPREAAFRKGCGPYWKRRDGWRTTPIIEKCWKRTMPTTKKGRMPCPGAPSPPSARTRACSCSTTRAGDCNVWKVTCSTTRTGISPPNSTGWRNWRYTTSVHPIKAYRTRPKGAPLCSPCKAGVSSSPKRRVICRTPLWPDSIRQPAVPCMRTVRRSGGLSRPSA